MTETSARPSLAALYDSYADFVHRSLIGLGVAPSRAEDAMQEVFIVASRHLSSFEGRFYKAWLFRLAQSVARNVRRAVQRAAIAPIDSLQLGDDGASPFDQAARAEERRLLQRLIEQIDEDQRKVFVLADLEEIAHVEIAAALGVHVNTVANRLHAARANLERLLRKHQQGPGSEGDQ